MTNNFTVAVSAVIPLFCLMFIGVLVRRSRLLSSTELNHLNRMVFRVFFSIMMFYNLYTADWQTAIHPQLMLFGSLGVLLIFGAMMGLVYAFETENQRRGAMVQAVFRSNFVLMGVPLVANIFGSDALAVPTMMIAIIVPIYNILSVLALETFRGGRFAPLPILRGILQNPMILGAITAILCRLAGLTLPVPLLHPLGQVAAATTPIALIVLGASFETGGTGLYRPQLWLCSEAKLFLVPAIILPLAAFMGFRGVDFVTLIAIFCTPCAVASFAMAQQMGSDAELAGNCVIITSALSCFTIFGWIFSSRLLGFI